MVLNGQYGQKWTKMVQNGTKWSTNFKNGQKCSRMGQNCQNCLKWWARRTGLSLRRFAKDKVKRPEGPPARSRAPELPVDFQLQMIQWTVDK